MSGQDVDGLRYEIINLRSALRRATCSVDGTQVRRYRMAALLTQAQVAAQVGIGVPYLSKIERGREQPSREVRDRIATALGVDVEDLLDPLPEVIR